jgi:hypothetical protein
MASIVYSKQLNPERVTTKKWSSWDDVRWNIHIIYHLVMTNIAMENPTIFKNGTPSISMGHRKTMVMLVITRG